jgi:hypothetical protein
MNKIEKFDGILRTMSPRQGLEEFLTYLHGTDFYTAPASTKYHGAREGGLLDHSLEVYEQLDMLLCMYEDNDMLQNSISKGSVALCGLLHDICKADFYATELRNNKNEQGVWEKVPFYTIKDRYPLGHGEKSVIILQRFMQLSIDETLAIRWHMAGFDDVSSSYGGRQALSAAMDQCKLITLLHMADLAASNLMEV